MYYNLLSLGTPSQQNTIIVYKSLLTEKCHSNDNKLTKKFLINKIERSINIGVK